MQDSELLHSGEEEEVEEVGRCLVATPRRGLGVVVSVGEGMEECRRCDGDPEDDGGTTNGGAFSTCSQLNQA
eukprot:3935760-Rhodomonas_salina.1